MGGLFCFIFGFCLFVILFLTNFLSELVIWRVRYYAYDITQWKIAFSITGPYSLELGHDGCTLMCQSVTCVMNVYVNLLFIHLLLPSGEPCILLLFPLY